MVPNGVYDDYIKLLVQRAGCWQVRKMIEELFIDVMLPKLADGFDCDNFGAK